MDKIIFLEFDVLHMDYIVIDWFHKRGSISGFSHDQ